MREHAHVSMFGDPRCRCTPEEAINLDVITRYRMAKVSERGPFFAPEYRRLRPGFKHLGELWGGKGMTDDSLTDKEIVLLHLEPRGDTVFGIWRVVGVHTGDFYGVPATGEPIDVIEVGLWRLEEEKIIEAWYFGDGLGFLRQAGITPPIEGET
jgi:hypothetical protein